MPVTRKVYVLGGIAGFLYVLVTIAVLHNPSPDPLETAVRLTGLLGLLSLSIAVIMIPFIPVMMKYLDMPFLRVHHAFAGAGLLSATVHPFLYAWTVASAAVFLPLHGSLYTFFSTGGRVALPLLYLAAGAAVFRRSLPRHWRSLHFAMYLTLLFAVVHGNLIGTDFSAPVIMVTFDGLALTAAGVFLFRVYKKGLSNSGTPLSAKR